MWRKEATGASPALAFAFAGAGADALVASPAGGALVVLTPRPLAEPAPVETDALIARLLPGLSHREGKWRFLTADLRQQVDAAATVTAHWTRLHVLTSGEVSGCADDLRWRQVGADPAADPGLAHFLIGNGSRSGDGEIEVTARAWPAADGPLVIALTGDARLAPPTDRQCRALTELIDYLRAKAGMIPVSTRDAPQWPVQAVERAYNATIPVWCGPPAPETAPR